MTTCVQCGAPSDSPSCFAPAGHKCRWDIDLPPAQATINAATHGSAPVADGGGLRFNTGKVRYELLPPEALDALAQHYTQSGGPIGGPAKNPDRHWERGMAVLICFGAMMRHAWKWFRGEDHDPETGSHHMIAVAWNAFAIFTYSVRNIGTDDRPSKAGTAST